MRFSWRHVCCSVGLIIVLVHLYWNREERHYDAIAVIDPMDNRDLPTNETKDSIDKRMQVKKAFNKLAQELKDTLTEHVIDHRLAVIVPYRNASEELHKFVPHLSQFLTKQGLSFTIYIVDQQDGFRFNRGGLINTGFLLAKESHDYIAMHDVVLCAHPFLYIHSLSRCVRITVVGYTQDHPPLRRPTPTSGSHAAERLTELLVHAQPTPYCCTLAASCLSLWGIYWWNLLVELSTLPPAEWVTS